MKTTLSFLLALITFPSLASAQTTTVKVDSDTISGLGARNIGSAAMSGRIAAIDAVQEGQRLTVFIGTASGGVWKSFNGGTTFKPVFDKQPVQSIGAVTIDPKNPKVIWVGTGESWTRNSVSVGDGVYKSVDGGENWTNMGLHDSERIAKIVVEARPDDTRRQCMPDVADVLANLIPGVKNLLLVRLALQIHEDRGDTGPREATQEIQVRRFLQLALQPFRDLLQGLFNGCAWPGGLHHHGLDDERRVFAAAEAEIREDSRADGDDHEISDERSMVECPSRKIEPGHCSDPSRRIFWPGCRACTPAVTTTSPASSPCDTTTFACSKRNTSIFRIETVRLDGSTIQTAGC